MFFCFCFFNKETHSRNFMLLEAEKEEAAAGGSRGGGQAGNQNKLCKHQWCVLPPQRHSESPAETGRFILSGQYGRQQRCAPQTCDSRPHLKLLLSYKEAERRLQCCALRLQTWTWLPTNRGSSEPDAQTYINTHYS